MSLKDKRVLITGGSGNIGSLLAKSLRQHCHTILRTDVRESNSDNGLFVLQDLTRDDAWCSFEGKVDTIFHLAAQTSAYRSNESIAKDWRINVQPIVQLLDFLKDKSWRPEIVFSSTATVIGLVDAWPVPPTVREVPTTMYDVHKLTVEKYLRYYAFQLGGRSASLRLANVYGPGEADVQAQDRGIVNQMIRKALDKETLTLFGSADYLRDYVYIQDVVDAFIRAGNHVSQLKGEAYFIGTGIGYTIKQLAEKIAQEVMRRTGSRVAIKQEPFPEGALSIEERSFIADSKNFQTITGWSPKIGLDQGLVLTADYFERNKNVSSTR